jgi:hypothetical protein
MRFLAIEVSCDPCFPTHTNQVQLVSTITAVAIMPAMKNMSDKVIMEAFDLIENCLCEIFTSAPRVSLKTIFSQSKKRTLAIFIWLSHFYSIRYRVDSLPNGISFN